MPGLTCPNCGGAKTRQAPACRACRYPRAVLPSTFGQWAVIGHAGRFSGVAMVDVRCACGETRRVSLKHLKSGASASCGCVGGKFAHGQAVNGRRTAEYRTWVTMNQRCGNPKNPRFSDYGGRGIVVCAEWKSSFEMFFREMGARPSADHSIDRIDNEKGYEPGNCRWATRSEQQRNTRRGRAI